MLDDPTPAIDRDLAEEDIATFERDGVVLLRRALHARWVVPFEIDRPAFREANKDIAFFPVPDIAAHRDSFDIVGWAVEPGDVVAFNLATLHGARGGRDVSFRRRTLSTRWAGDDVRYT